MLKFLNVFFDNDLGFHLEFDIFEFGNICREYLSCIHTLHPFKNTQGFHELMFNET